MTQTMKALVYDRKLDDWSKSKGLRLQNVPIPQLDESIDPADADNVLIKVHYAGFCGSDRGIWFRKSFGDAILNSLDKENKDKRIVGHELLGEIIACGSRASSHYNYKPGNIVSTESHIICGKCHQCRIGQTHVCADDIIIGISRDGCFAEYIKLPANVIWPTNTKLIEPKIGAIQEPFGNAVHCCTKVDLRGKTVAVMGCGTIGLFVILIAKALGAARVIGIEPLEDHREMALALGADHVIPLDLSIDRKDDFSADPAIVDALHKLTDGEGVDIAMEMSGFNSSVNNAIKSTRRGGEVILFGLKAGNHVIQDLDRVIVDGLSIHSVIGRRIFETWYLTKSLLEAKHLGIQEKIRSIILNDYSDTIFHINEFNPATFETAISKHPKVILKFI